MVWEKFVTMNLTHSSWRSDAKFRTLSAHFTSGRLLSSLSLSINRKAAFRQDCKTKLIVTKRQEFSMLHKETTHVYFTKGHALTQKIS